jgi:hypothetical protein
MSFDGRKPTMKLNPENHQRGLHRIAAAFSLAFFAALALPASAAVTVTITSPTPNQLRPKDLRVVATVTSTFELQTVVAVVEDRSANLAFSDGAWRGAVNLNGLARGPLTVTVTGNEAFGGSGQDSETFVYDNPPDVTVVEPLSESVARPTIRVVASCTDDDPVGCTGMAIRFGGACEGENVPVLFSTTAASIDTVVDLSSRDGTFQDLCIDAFDSANQRTTPEPVIYVESSPYLVELASAPTQILDFDPTRLLWKDTSVSPPVLKITNFVALTEETILPQDPGAPWRDGALSDVGAVVERDPVGPGLELGDWSGGLLQLVPAPLDVYLAAGPWALLTDNVDNLVLRDLATTTDTTLAASDVGASRYLLRPDGQVLFVAPNANGPVNRHVGGVTTTISPVDGKERFPLVSDGTGAAWGRRESPTTYSLQLWDGGTGELELAPTSSHQPTLAMNQGWLSYSRAGSAGIPQAWVRSPGGTSTQLTFFAVASLARVLDVDPTGAVRFRSLSTSRVVQARPGNPILLELTRGHSRNFERFGDTLYLAIGRTLFRLDAPLFEDGFESGSTSAWTTTVGGS